MSTCRGTKMYKVKQQKRGEPKERLDKLNKIAPKQYNILKDDRNIKNIEVLEEKESTKLLN